MFRKLRRKIVRLAVVSGAGAAATYFFDKERGIERREQAKAKASSLLKRDGASTPDWQSHGANGFDTTATATSTPATAASTPYAPTSAAPTLISTSGDFAGTAPVDLLVVEERTITAP